MPSTYNNNLRLEIIANGEQAGTWGATTNTNLGTLLVDAITSTVEVNVIAANQAFTVANGSTDESRCAAIVLTTTTGANFNVYAPSVAKLYVIKNSSAYQATIYCNSATPPAYGQAGAGYSIPAGRTVFIRSSNETTGNWEFKNCIDSFGTTGLPVVSGGTGLTTIPALSVPVANSLNTLTTLAPTANQSIRINSAGTAWEAYTPSGGSGSVSSVGLSMPVGIFTVTNSPVISTGTLTATLDSQSANLILASPSSTSGTPTFRALVTNDLPTVATVTPNTYGSASQVAQITVDAKGRITSVTNVAISGGGGGVTSINASPPLSASASTGAVTLSISNASSSSSGVVTTGSQNFAGSKTFDNTLYANGFQTNNLAYNFTASSSVFYNGSGFSFDYSLSRVIDLNISTTKPGADNSMTLGASGARWSTVYAANGTINTSDANEKQDIADLDEAEKRVAVRIKGLIKKFRFKDAVIAKGDAARIHVGVIAQEVRDAFTAEGLDAHRYGLFCSDTWWEREEMVERKHLDAPRLERVIYTVPTEGATEKTRLGVRYEQLLAFVIAAM